MGRLTIQEIAKVLIVKNGLEQSEANRFATELFAIIQERLEKNDQVKVKGLGTWKVITVEARESVSVRTGDRVMIDEHSKITFTPDATMKELVNKPFSQFETVVLNDNVEFDDLKDQPVDTEFEDGKEDLNEEEPESLDEAPAIVPFIEAPQNSIEEAPQEENTEEAKVEIHEEPQEKLHEDPQEELLEEPKEQPVVEIPKVKPEDTSKVMYEEAPKVMPEETLTFVSDDAYEAESFSWNKWLWIAFGGLCLVVLSALGGYHYGGQQMAKAIMSDTLFIRDTVYVTVNQDSVNQDSANTLAPVEAAVEQEPVKVEEPKVEKPKTEEPKVEKPKAEPAPEVDKYAMKDERVRHGAYRIVGLDHEVTVLQGQTFYSIYRAHLGPDMECYIEVYNDMPRNPQIKAGQVIKIPKLQLKKRKKQ